ncbi:MAG: DUF3515 domain-containing protein [Microbacteriaceae bacterium]
MKRKLFIYSGLSVVLTLAGCQAAVPMEPAALSNDPECAEVIVRLPDTIGSFDRRSTNAQSTAAWGDPSAVLLRCGLEPSGPSALPCFTVNGVDWLRDDSQAPLYLFTTYGRTPAVEVFVDADVASGTEALDALGNSVGVLPTTGKCLAPEDVFAG